MRTLLPLAAAAALLLAGCVADDAPPTEATPTPATDADASDPDGAFEPEPVALSFFERAGVGIPPTTMGISPASLDLMEDKPYLLQLTNDGQAPHDLVIEGMDVDTDTFAPGETLEIELIPQEKGDYVFYCSVGGDGPAGHRAQGMEGTITVA